MRVVRVFALAALVGTALTAPAAAQSWKFDWGVNGGYSWMSKMLGEDQTGLADGTGGQKINFAPGWLAGTQLTFWPSSKIGLRANVRYGSRDIKGNNMGAADDFDFVEDVNLWGGTGDLLFRFKSPADEFTKMEMLPYLALGVGAKWHNPGGDQNTCQDLTAGKEWACAPFTLGLGTATPRTFAIAEERVLTGLVALGADWRLSRGLALRTEISDQIFNPEVNVATATAANTFSVNEENVSKVVHELGAQIGLHFLLGVPRTEVVSAPAPAPEILPPPPPAPVVPAAPVSESVSVCVIDASAPGGIRTETALFYPVRGDTMLTVNGREVLLRDAVGNITVASNADWYVRGQPLTLTVTNNDKIEYVTFGTAKMVSGSDLAFLGTVNGVPVYASRDDVSSIASQLDDLNRAQRGADLPMVLASHKDIRKELSNVKVVYVPLQATGCVFQPLTLQEQVRKNR